MERNVRVRNDTSVLGQTQKIVGRNVVRFRNIVNRLGGRLSLGLKPISNARLRNVYGSRKLFLIDALVPKKFLQPLPKLIIHIQYDKLSLIVL